MRPEECPALVKMALVLREGLLPHWEPDEVARAVTDALRPHELPIARRVAALCWADPTTDHPGRLSTAGPWWARCGLKPPRITSSLPVVDPAINARGVKFCREQLDAALRRKATRTTDEETQNA